MDYQRRPVITGTIQATLAISLDFTQVYDTFDRFGWTAQAILKTKLFMRHHGKKLRHATSQKKKECNAIADNLANATTFGRPRHIPLTQKSRLDILVKSSLSAYEQLPIFIAEYRNGVDGGRLRLTTGTGVTSNYSATAHRGRSNLL